MPSTGTSNNGKILAAGSSAGDIGWQDNTWINLSDTPSSFTASKYVAVNSSGDALELVDAPSGGGGGGGEDIAIAMAIALG